MNREQAKQVLANMKMVEAFANGEEIQILSGGGIWNDIGECATFTARPEFYRIKPKKVSISALVDKDGTIIHILSDHEKFNVKNYNLSWPEMAPHRIVHLTEASE